MKTYQLSLEKVIDKHWVDPVLHVHNLTVNMVVGLLDSETWLNEFNRCSIDNDASRENEFDQMFFKYLYNVINFNHHYYLFLLT